MLYYEMKKVFSGYGSKIALLILGILIFLGLRYCIITSVWVNENGEEEKGIRSIKKLREATAEWSGALTEERITQVIHENDRINGTTEAQSEDIRQQNIAYGWKQGFAEIRNIINYSFCEFREYDYYKVDTLSAADADQFYLNRVKSLQRWLDGEAKYYYSDLEKEYFINQYEKMKKPLDYEYMDGWKNLFEYSSTILMIMSIIIAVIVAPIFSCEKQLSADSVLYASYHGRDKAVSAKLLAGFLITTIIYWSTMLIYSCSILGVFGVDGAECQIQVADSWKSFYNITNVQEYIIVLFGGYVGCIFMTTLTMFVSARFKSTVLAAIVPFILIFAPTFLSTINSRRLTEIIALLPDQLLQMNRVLNLFHTYQIVGIIFGAVYLLFIIYVPLTLLLQPVIYRIYRKSEIQC